MTPLPSAEERAQGIWLWLSKHGLSKDYIKSQVLDDRDEVLEAAAEQYVERQEQRWRKFFEPSKSESARRAFAMMMQGVRCEADEIRKLKAQP